MAAKSIIRALFVVAAFFALIDLAVLFTGTDEARSWAALLPQGVLLELVPLAFAATGGWFLYRGLNADGTRIPAWQRLSTGMLLLVIAVGPLYFLLPAGARQVETCLSQGKVYWFIPKQYRPGLRPGCVPPEQVFHFERS